MLPKVQEERAMSGARWVFGILFALLGAVTLFFAVLILAPPFR
jgi:hypothetical protein